MVQSCNVLDWDQLRFISALRRARTLGGAARLLRVNKTTVMRRIAALEQALETRLFVRTAAGYALSPAGQEIAEDIERAEEAIFAIERRLKGRDAKVEGKVRLTCSETMSEHILGSLAEFRDRHPRLEVELVVTSRVLNLARREADLAVRMRRPEQAQLIGQKVAAIPLQLFASRRYLQLRGMPVPGQMEGHDVLTYDDELAPLGQRPPVQAALRGGTFVFRTNGTLAMRAAIAAGLGVGVLPQHLGEGHPALVSLGPLRDATEIWLVTHRDVRSLSRVRAVRDHLAQSFRALRSSTWPLRTQKGPAA